MTAESKRRIPCRARIFRGPRAGLECRNEAAMIFVPEVLPVCGIHARAYTAPGLARIAYHHPVHGWQ